MKPNTECKYLIIVTWFKRSGKDYSTGNYHTIHQHMYEVFNEFQAMLDQGIRPGLVNSRNNEFYAVLDCNNHPHGYPAMFTPKV